MSIPVSKGNRPSLEGKPPVARQVASAMAPTHEGVIELVDPTGRLHLVPRDRLEYFCASVGLERPDNVARLDQKDSPYKFSQQWQALNKMRWLQCVDKKTRLPVPGVPFQPVLGEASYFLRHVACNNPNMQNITVANRDDFSRLFGKKPPPQYKGWAAVQLSLEHAREYFMSVTINHYVGSAQPQVGCFNRHRFTAAALATATPSPRSPATQSPCCPASARAALGPDSGPFYPSVPAGAVRPAAGSRCDDGGRERRQHRGGAAGEASAVLHDRSLRAPCCPPRASVASGPDWRLCRHSRRWRSRSSSFPACRWRARAEAAPRQGSR